MGERAYIKEKLNDRIMYFTVMASFESLCDNKPFFENPFKRTVPW